jgi:hypothetical protein
MSDTGELKTALDWLPDDAQALKRIIVAMTQRPLNDVDVPAASATQIAPFDEWFDSRVRKPDGSRYSKRARQKFKSERKPPIIRLGWSETVNIRTADAWLSSLAQNAPCEQQPRRGRPRTYPQN